MQYTLEKIKDLWKEHDSNMGCVKHVSSDSIEDAVQNIINLMKENKKQRVFAYTRPVLTIQAFIKDIKLFNYLIQNHNDMFFSYYPQFGFWFFRSKKAKKDFDHSGPWKGKEVRCFNSMKLYTKCAYFKNKDNGKEDYIMFDEISDGTERAEQSKLKNQRKRVAETVKRNQELFEII